MLRDLVWILENICCGGYKVALFRAAFLVTFFGVFRISELVPGSHRYSSVRSLELQDTHWEAQAAILNLHPLSYGRVASPGSACGGFEGMNGYKTREGWVPLYAQ